MSSFENSLEIMLENAPTLGQRASLLAANLGAQFPAASLAACFLKDRQGSSFAVLDNQGQPRSDWAEQLKEEVLSWLENANSSTWEGLALAHSQVMGEKITSQDRVWGVLAIGLPTDAHEETCREKLAHFGRYVGLRLTLEEEKKWQTDNILKQRFLGDIGEIARPIVHELYNLLNTLSLQVEVLKVKFPEAASADLAILKKQVVGMVDVLKWFRQYRSHFLPEPHKVELNQVIRQTVAELKKENLLGLPVNLDLAPEPMWVLGSEIDVERIVRYLLTHAGHPGSGQPIQLTTKSAGNKFLLTVEPFQHGPMWELHQALEGGKDSKEITMGLELAACKMLLERFRGKALTETLPQKGVRIVVELPNKSIT